MICLIETARGFIKNLRLIEKSAELVSSITRVKKLTCFHSTLIKSMLDNFFYYWIFFFWKTSALHNCFRSVLLFHGSKINYGSDDVSIRRLTSSSLTNCMHFAFDLFALFVLFLSLADVSLIWLRARQTPQTIFFLLSEYMRKKMNVGGSEMNISRAGNRNVREIYAVYELNAFWYKRLTD